MLCPASVFIRVYARLIICLVCATMCTMTSVTHAQTWERLPDMPVAVAAPALSLQGRNAVVTGGVVLGSGSTKAVQVLDLDTMTWRVSTALVHARYQHAQITLQDGRILIVGGRKREPATGPVTTASCELISADLTSCELTAELPIISRTPTLHMLGDGRVVSVGVHIVAIFDPENETWETQMPLRQRRSGHTSVMLDDGTILVAGGVNNATFERVDLQAGESTMLRVRLPMALDDLAMVKLPDGRLWVIGGQSSTGETTDRSWLLSLDPDAGDRLVEGPALGLAGGMADHLAIPTPGGIVVVGGESQHAGRDTELTDAFRLNPRTLTVTRLPDTPIAHDDAAGFLDGRSAVVLGGQVKASFLGMPVPTPIRAVHRITLDSEKAAYE